MVSGVLASTACQQRFDVDVHGDEGREGTGQWGQMPSMLPSPNASVCTVLYAHHYVLIQCFFVILCHTISRYTRHDFTCGGAYVYLLGGVCAPG